MSISVEDIKNQTIRGTQVYGHHVPIIKKLTQQEKDKLSDQVYEGIKKNDDFTVAQRVSNQIKFMQGGRKTNKRRKSRRSKRSKSRRRS